MVTSNNKLVQCLQKGSSRKLVALEIYKKGEVTLSKAAEIAGLNSFAFKELLIKNGVKIYAQKESRQELKQGMQHLKNRIFIY